MWENRPAVPSALSSPCMDCKLRQAPKTCESTCDKWKKYQEEKLVYDEQRKLEKDVKTMLFRNYYTTQNKK